MRTNEPALKRTDFFKVISIGMTGLATIAFCLLILLLAHISAIMRNPYFHFLEMFFSDPYQELSILQSLELPRTEWAVSLTASFLNLSIGSSFLALLLIPWRESCFIATVGKVSFHSIKDNVSINLPLFIPAVGLYLAMFFGLTLRIAVGLDFSATSSYSTYSPVIDTLHIQSLYQYQGAWDGVFWGRTALYSLIFFAFGVFIFRVRSGLRAAISEAIIGSSLILTTFELMIFRNVVLGYSGPGLDFMHHTVISQQFGWGWFSNFDALAVGIALVTSASIARWKLC